VADRRVRAEWAYVGKAPATLAYDILATSGGDTDFGGYVGRYATGSPKSGMSPDAPGAPPWVTFGPMVSPSDEILISVSVQEPAQDRDQSGRPISPQRLFLIRYADIADVGGSYLSLWEALQDVGLPAPGHAPMTAGLAAQSAESLVATIERYGPERMTALAAMILEDRIALTDSAGLPRAERLAVLDAAVALLPYGFRAALSVSSAVNNATTHEIDLVFAEFANEKIGQAIVQLSAGAPIPVPRTKLGRSYQDMLREKIRNLGLPAVVEHLWAATGPCSLQHQDAALDILTLLDFDGSLRRALHDGTATRAQVVSFFGRDPALVNASWRSPVMTEPMRRSALQFVLEHPDGAAAEVLLAHWPTVEDDLCTVSSRDLDADEPTLAMWCLRCARAYSADHEDLFLARLLASDLAIPSTRPKRVKALAQLLDGLEPPRLDQLPLAKDQVRQDTDEKWAFLIFRTLLTRQTQSGGRPIRAMAWASWLCLPGPGPAAEVPAWAATLQPACDPAGSAAPAGFVPGDLVWAGVLLRLMKQASRLPSALPLVLDDLVRMANTAAAAATRPDHSAALPRDMRFLLDSLDVDLGHAGVRPDALAKADVVRILLQGRPQGFPANIGDERYLDGYLDGLRHALSVLPAQSCSWAAAQFLTFVVPADPHQAPSAEAIWLLNSWSAEPDLAAEVARFIVELDQARRPVDERLASSYWECVALVPALTGYASTPRLAAAVRAVLADRQLLARWTGPNGVPNTSFALSWHQARRAGLPVSEILRILNTAGPDRIRPRDLDDVIREFQGLVHHDPELAAGALADLFACYQDVARGAFGRQYGVMFTREAITRFEDEIRIREELIRVLGGSLSNSRRRLFWRRLFRLGRGTRQKQAGPEPAGPEPAGPEPAGPEPAGRELPGAGQQA
jgi:hypothetical protein